MKLLTFILLALVASVLLLTPVHRALAATGNNVDDVCTVQGASTSTFCQSKSKGDNPIAGPNGAINRAVTIFSIIAGVAAIIIIVIGALQYVLSGGESSNVDKAKNTILYALVGLVIIVIAQAIIRFVLSKVG